MGEQVDARLKGACSSAGESARLISSEVGGSSPLKPTEIQLSRISWGRLLQRTKPCQYVP